MAVVISSSSSSSFSPLSPPLPPLSLHPLLFPPPPPPPLLLLVILFHHLLILLPLLCSLEIINYLGPRVQLCIPVGDCTVVVISFRGFSGGFCSNEGKVIWYQLELGKQLADVLTECSSCQEGESEEVGINIAIYSHALLKIHVIGSQKLVRLFPLSLPFHHSSPASRDFKSSISVEVLL